MIYSKVRDSLKKKKKKTYHFDPQDLTNNFPYSLPYNSYYVSLETWKADDLKIP